MLSIANTMAATAMAATNKVSIIWMG